MLTKGQLPVRRAAAFAAALWALFGAGCGGNEEPTSAYEVLLTGRQWCGSLEVDAEAVYVTYQWMWGHPNTIDRIVPGVPGHTELMRDGLSIVSYLASDADHVYWASGWGSQDGTARSAVGRARKDGGEPPEVLVAGESCRNPALIGSDVYYSCKGGEEVSFRQVLERLSLTDRTRQQMLVAEEGIGLSRIRAFDGQLYGSYGDCILQFGAPGEPPREVGCAADWPLSFTERYLWGYAIQGGFLYVAVVQSSVYNGAIVRVPLAGGSAEVLAEATADDPELMAVHDGYVYWFQGHGNSFSHEGDTQIARVPVEGGPVEVVMDHLNGPQDLSFEGDFMYWCDYANGDIARARVP